MSSTLLASPQHSFRDPAGTVEIRPDGVYRSVNPAYASDILTFLALPLASQLVYSGQLISTEILPKGDVETATAESESLLLLHPRISFPSYPWEWSSALWIAAAELTLNLCADLVRQGWILKDATPLNVLFQGTRPIFVDLLSIQVADLTRPVWFAYGQFVRTFLLPMLAHSRLGWPFQTTLLRRDGFEPEDIYLALSWVQRLQRPALTSVTLPLLLSRKGAQPSATHGPASRTVSDPEIARQVLLNTLSALRHQMHRAAPSPRPSNWSEYVQTASHYSPGDHLAKRDFVRNALAAAKSSHVLDVGCNTGIYSILAAETGAEVVSIDTDLQAVDRLYAAVKDTHSNILPLCVDIAHPTPASGWENRENSSFLIRASGHFDTVMMLAVIHHLLLLSQIPLDRIASVCSSLTTRHLIIEWVPPHDPMFQSLLRGRDSLYAHITEAAFREAFAPLFTIVSESTLDNGRILFHLQRR